jgi:hypothetical protein
LSFEAKPGRSLKKKKNFNIFDFLVAGHPFSFKIQHLWKLCLPQAYPLLLQAYSTTVGVT